MNREEPHTGFDLNLISQAWEIASFDPALGRACTTATFRPDLNGTPRTAWNKSCCRVFLQSFLALEANYTRDDEPAIENCFYIHLRYLQTLFKDTEHTSNYLRDRQLDRNRARRKGTVRLFLV